MGLAVDKAPGLAVGHAMDVTRGLAVGLAGDIAMGLAAVISVSRCDLPWILSWGLP